MNSSKGWPNTHTVLIREKTTPLHTVLDTLTVIHWPLFLCNASMTFPYDPSPRSFSTWKCFDTFRLGRDCADRKHSSSSSLAASAWKVACKQTHKSRFCDRAVRGWGFDSVASREIRSTVWSAFDDRQRKKNEVRLHGCTFWSTAWICNTTRPGKHKSHVSYWLQN